MKLFFVFFLFLTLLPVVFGQNEGGKNSTTPSRPQLTEFEKGQIVFARNVNGWSYRKIAEHFGRTPSCIERFLKKYGETKNFDRTPGSGRKRKTTDRDDRALKFGALKKRRTSSGNIHV